MNLPLVLRKYIASFLQGEELERYVFENLDTKSVIKQLNNTEYDENVGYMFGLNGMLQIKDYVYQNGKLYEKEQKQPEKIITDF